MTVVDRDLGFKALLARFKELGGRSLTVGVHKEDGADEHGDSEATVAQIAAWIELGTTRMPARSWLRETLDSQRRQIRTTIRDATRSVMSNRRRVKSKRAMEVVGADIVRRIQARIRDGIPPPLDPATIAAKGSSTPLIDSGQFIQSITFEVK